MSLQADALRLTALDRRLVRAVIEGNAQEFANLLSDYLILRDSLKVRLLDKPVAVVEDADAAEVLRKIFTDDGLPSDTLIERLSSRMEDDPFEINQFDAAEIEQLGSDLFYSWFSHHEYVTGIAELRPLVLQASVSEPVSQLVRQAKDCYAFQQYDAAYALCRMVIEASVRDVCLRYQIFPDLGQNVVLFEKFTWGRLRDKVCSGPLRERLQNLYADLSAVIHSRKTVSRNEARKAFEETLQVIEQLYAYHGC